MFEVRLKGLINRINGNNQAIMTTQIAVRDLLKVFMIDNSINREINYARLKPLSKYIDSFDSDIGIFLPSLVFSFNEDPIKYYDKERKELRIDPGVKLKVIDGQHRIKGLEYLIRDTGDIQRRENILDSTLTAQIYFGLKDIDEKNVFVDINSNAKRVSMSLITQYDTRDIMRVLVRDTFNTCQALEIAGVELSKSRIVRPNNTLLFTSARLKNFIIALLFGKVKIGKKGEKLIQDKYDDILAFLDKFFTVLFDALPPIPGDVMKYVLGHEGLQNAIAFYLHEEIIVESEKDLIWIPDWELSVEKLKYFDWSIRNSLFQPYMITSKTMSGQFRAFIDNRHQPLLKILKNELA